MVCCFPATVASINVGIFIAIVPNCHVKRNSYDEVVSNVPQFNFFNT